MYTDIMDQTTLEKQVGGYSSARCTNAPLCLTQLYRLQMNEPITGHKCLKYLILYGLVMEKYMQSPDVDISEKSCITAVSALLSADCNPEIARSLLVSTY